MQLSQKQADDWRERIADAIDSLAKSQGDFRRTTRMIFQAIGVILVIVALAMMGLAAALWTLK